MRTIFILDLGIEITYEQILWLVALILTMPCLVLLADAISRRLWR